MPRVLKSQMTLTQLSIVAGVMVLPCLSTAAAPIDRNDPELLTAVMLDRLTFKSTKKTGRTCTSDFQCARKRECVNDTCTAQISHCRNAPGGCETRLSTYAHYFYDAQRKHGVDAWLLAAISKVESGWHGGAQGAAGELGVLQVMRSHRSARRVRFYRDKKYRERCRHQVGGCQAEVIDLAAGRLRKYMAQCGSVNAALGRYNRGRCQLNTSYAKRVTNEHKRLLGIARRISDATR